jgi:hypothetical protein
MACVRPRRGATALTVLWTRRYCCIWARPERYGKPPLLVERGDACAAFIRGVELDVKPGVDVGSL